MSTLPANLNIRAANSCAGLDFVDTVLWWTEQPCRVALATVLRVEGSGPVGPGPAFAVNDRGDVAGSIGGGCVEGALIEEARRVLDTATTCVLTYGDGDPLVDAVSLCGGSFTIELQLVTADVLETLLRDRRPRRPLYLIGANAYAQALGPLATQLGYDVTVIDPRPVFFANRLFDGVTQRIGWPEDVVPVGTLGNDDAVVLLAHDDRFEVPFLPRVLRSSAGYIGALGSRAAHARRIARLRDAHVSNEQIARLAAPVGLDLGGQSAMEVAVAIAGEMIALRHGRSGCRLTESI